MGTGNNTEAYELLRKTGLSDTEAVKLIDIIGKMASTNLISRLESKIDSQNAKIDAQNTKYNVLIVVIAIIGAALTIALSIS